MFSSDYAHVFALLVQVCAALPPRDPTITPSPVIRDSSKTFHRRGVVSDVESGVGGILSGLGSDLPSWVASGVPNFFQGKSGPRLRLCHHQR